MGRNGSKIALRRNFYVAFRTLLEFNLRREFTRTINRALPLGRSGEWLVWCRKETTRHGPGPARDRTAGWQPRPSAASECGAATSGKNAPKPDRAALWPATDQLFRTGW